MKFIKKNRYKLLVVLAVLLVIIFTIPNISEAKGFIESAGGKLWDPIQDFLIWIGDCVLNIMQTTFQTQQRIVVTANSNSEQEGISAWNILAIVGCVVLLIVGVAFCWTGIGDIAAGFSMAALVSLLKGVCIGVLCGTVAVVGFTKNVEDMSNKLSGDFDIPMISYTPYAIFSNQIQALDINFINPMKDSAPDTITVEGEEKIDFDLVISAAEKLVEGINKITQAGRNDANYDSEIAERIINGNSNTSGLSMVNYLIEWRDGANYSEDIFYSWYSPNTIMNTIRIYMTSSTGVSGYINMTQSEYDELMQSCGTGEGGAHFGQVTYAAVAPCSSLARTSLTTNTVIYESSAKILQPIISGWYYTLRNLALVGLLSVLVYIGIRIVISSSVNDKAKYKSMIMDWVISICLVFFLHYIMVFIIEINSQLTNMFANNITENILVDLPNDTKIKDGENSVGLLDMAKEQDGFEVSDTGHPRLVTNFVGYARLIAGGYDEYDTMTSTVYCIIYLVLVIYTVIFTVVYLKRVLYMAFLTVVAPLVCLTYPIDKISDGKAQAFNMWIKEYIFNALLQPIHLLLYTIIIGSVMDLAVKYPIYALVALGFMVPAEKIIRKMFGFEKAQTPGALGGAAGTALMMTGMQRVLGRPPHGKREGEPKENSEKGNNKLNFAKNFDSKEAMSQSILERGKNDYTKDSIRELGSRTDTTEKEKQYRDDNNIDSSGRNTLSEREEQLQHDDTSRINYNDSYNKLNEENNLPNQDSNEINYNDNLVKENFKNEDLFKDINKEYKKSNIPDVNTVHNSRNIRRGLQNVAHKYKRNVNSNINKKLKNTHPIRTLRRATTAAIGGAAIGALGLASGIASGDLSKVFQYTTTGAALGGKFVKGTGDKISGEANNITKGGTKAFDEGFYGNEYQEHAIIRDIKNNPEFEEFLDRQNISKKDKNEFIKEHIPYYVKDYGMTNYEDMYTTFQLEKEGQSRTEAVASVQLANDTGDLSKSPDAEEKWMKNYTSKMQNDKNVQIAAQEKARWEVARNEELQKLKKEYDKEAKKAKENKKNNFDEIKKRYNQQRNMLEKSEYDKYRKQYASVVATGMIDRANRANELKKLHK